MKNLIDEVTKGWQTRLDALRDPLHEFILIFKAEKAEAGSPQEQVSGMTKAAVKVDEIATLIAQLAKASDTLVEIDSMFDDIINFFEKLEPVFLQQNNKRKTLHDAQVKVRIGKLHG
jgi:hypothetical protein